MIENKKRMGIFSGNFTESLVVKNLLESYMISVYYDNSLMAVFNPWGVTVGGMNKAKLRVQEDDYERAKKIVDNYHSNKLSS